MNTEKEKVLVIVGPTASGKTAAAVETAKVLNGEIISADSMQIYRKMTIGTAKPSRKEMGGIPHYMIDCVDPDQPYSVADYVIEAEKWIKDIISRGKVPIVCGGTGLYINGLTLPWAFGEDHRDDDVRKALEIRAAEQGAEPLYRELCEADPETAEELHPHNVKRVIRALEIYRVTGHPKSYWDRENRKRPLPYHYVMTGLQWDRQLLYQRIDQRVDAMVDAGLPDEARFLLSAGYTPDLISMKAIGYKELFPYLEGKASLEETLFILKRDTRHFAKRQLTWFRKDERIRWFVPADYSDTTSLAADIAAYFRGEHER